ncbi:MAG: class I SAM-dependent methyltransferase [Planctomycetes bacterium]|nr:class I SAM-dependent methyltransferase [Planctomycetota bacterium]
MSAQFRDHFSHDSACYAAHRPTYPVELVEFLARESPARGRVWEAGCGSGQLSLLLPKRFEHVLATDASAQQIAAASAHPRVEYRVAPAEASGLPDRCADLVVAAQAAHWFELERFYAEVRRVARPGALLALVSYAKTRIGADLDPLLDEFHDRTLLGHWPAERAHVVEGYARLVFPFARLAVPELAIRRDWSVEQLLAYIRTWSGVNALVKTGAGIEFERFERELRARWGSPAAKREVRWPLCVLAARL